MTLKLSTGFVKDFLDQPALPIAAVVGTGLTFVDGGGGLDSITRSSGSFITDGFQVGDWIQVFNATTGANDFAAKIQSVAALTLEIPTGTVNTGESGAADTVVVSAKGASIKDLLQYGVIRIYSGAQPANADAAETGTLLVTITDAGGTHVIATGENGLEFEDDAASYTLSKLATQEWSGAPGNAGTAGWFRFYAQEYVTGASTTAVRLDGSISTSGAQMNVANPVVTVGVDFLINEFDIIIPAV